MRRASSALAWTLLLASMAGLAACRDVLLPLPDVSLDASLDVSLPDATDAADWQIAVDTRNPDVATGARLGAPCVAATDCASHYCSSSGRCTTMCSNDGECVRGWRCVGLDGARFCACARTPLPVDDPCDGYDNNCNGIVDETPGTCFQNQICGRAGCECISGLTNCIGTCVDTATAWANCGACGTVCGQRQSCVAGVCR